MRIGIFSDLQLHSWRSFGLSDDNIISKRLKNQIDILEQIYQIVVENRINVLIFGGDLFHKRGEIPVECINVISEWLKKIEMQCKVLFVRGNHDLFSNKKYHKLYDAINFLSSNNKTKFNIELPGHKSVSIKLVNYFDTVDCANTCDYDIVVLHKQPDLINEYNHHFQGEDWQKIASQNKLVFFGHYHKRVRLSNNCFVIGSPLALTFDDKDDRGMYIVDTAGVDGDIPVADKFTYDLEIVNDYAVSFVKLGYPKFITVNESSEVVHGDGNYYRVLNAKKKSDDENVINVIKPEYFDERIKSNDFNDVVQEWLAINKLDSTYLLPIEDILSKKMQSVKKLYGGKVVSIKAKNFISLGDVELKVEDGFTLVSGLNLDTNDSNGSGKSSLFEALYWCLFGETTKGLTGDDVVRRGCSDCWVSVELYNELEDCYSIERTRKGGLEVHRSDTDLVDGLKQIDRQIFLEEQVLGFDKNVFKSSCYFSQENVLMFTGLSDVEKTQMLTKLLGFETYGDLYTATFDKIKKFNIELEDIDNEKRTVENNVKVNKAKIDMIVKLVDENQVNVANVKVRISNCENKINQVKSEVINEIVETVDYDSDIKSTTDEIEAGEQSKEAIDIGVEVLLTQRDELDRQCNKLDIKRDMLITEKSKINIHIENMRNNNAIGERCDKCGSLVSQDNIDVFIEEKLREIELINTEINSLNIQISQLEIEVKEVNDKIKAEKGLSTLSEVNIKSLRDKLKNLNYLKVQYQEKFSKIEKEKIQRDSIIRETNMLIKAYKDQISNYEVTINNKINEQNSLLQTIVDLEQKVKEFDWRIDKVNKGIEILEFWKKSFSPTGIRTLLLDRFCNEFNSLVNEYLSTVSSGTMSITVSPTKVLKSGEERNKIGLDIYLNEVQVKYESLSGGEKRRVDVSLCMTLNRWVRMKYQLSHGLLGVLILDELFSYVDHLGEEAIATLLYDEGRDKAVYVVSHTSDLSSYGDKMITIVKSAGISSIG